MIIAYSILLVAGAMGLILSLALKVSRKEAPRETENETLDDLYAVIEALRDRCLDLESRVAKLEAGQVERVLNARANPEKEEPRESNPEPLPYRASASKTAQGIVDAINRGENAPLVARNLGIGLGEVELALRLNRSRNIPQ